MQTGAISAEGVTPAAIRRTIPHMQATTKSTLSSNLWPWMVAILMAQAAWGAYPVLARYLQTISQLPSLSILGLGNLVAFVIMGAIFLPRFDWSTLRHPLLPLFAVIVCSRGITNFLAARYTLATYVQLITLLTPFLVALLSRVVLHEQLPKYLGRALFITLIGALLIMSNSLGAAAQAPLTRSDAIGMGLAAFSSLMLAIYMLLVRRSADSRVSGVALMMTQFVSLTVVSLGLSWLVGEDWGAWTNLGRVDWTLFLLLAIGVFCGANLAQIGGLRHLGAPMVSSMLALRLVFSLLLAALLLGEHLSSIWQFAGAIIVIITITWFLWQQRQGNGKPSADTLQ